MDGMTQFAIGMGMPPEMAEGIGEKWASTMVCSQAGDVYMQKSFSEMMSYYSIFRDSEEYTIPGRDGFHVIDTACGDGTYINIEKGNGMTLKWVSKVGLRFLVSDMEILGKPETRAKVIMERVV